MLFFGSSCATQFASRNLKLETNMALSTFDWIIIAAFLLLSLFISLRVKNSAGKDLASFFLGGRKLPWYVAGISMVATTFAADTPLWVAEKVSQHGVSGNWLWWNMLTGGMVTTFFFAKLWRRSGVVTELEFIELRYSGKAAQLLRGFRSIYMGLFLNVVIIAWVNVALGTILMEIFKIPQENVLWFITGAMLIVAAYSAISGLIGVALTDAVQFFIAMIGCIILAWFVLDHEAVGGLAGLKAQLPAWRLNLLPDISTNGSLDDVVGKYSVTLGAFLSFALVQWWASWYPGAEPGGGGYVAQRMLSAKNEQHALWATLFFQIAHYCLRPWPWIIVSLGILLIYPDTTPLNAGQHFIAAIGDLLPSGLKGLLIVSFIGAYMSTISTQLNWGASYITNDLIKRNNKRNYSEKKLVGIAKLTTIVICLLAIFATSQVQTIDAAAQFLINCGAGLGLVLIVRWFWWRVNAWSEIVATIAPIIGYSYFQVYLEMGYPYGFLATLGFATVCWLIATFVTKPEKPETLQHFYNTVKPYGNWKPVVLKNLENKKVKWLAAQTLSSLVLTYGILLGTGELLIGDNTKALYYGLAALVGFTTLMATIKKA